ncbi:hypothetical protein [Thioalkalivibrio sp. XN8]|uniref:hypothetical protein n=1 Tax=Thioalkalivibrio sp. XN8 TaxID=2712863 RepID=UPI0013EB0EDA|nr:hypothetical protein [Thioalkalivibrio sp. XN8]NGP53601.1 hypothetical protein [Thioalkalivibrio sp. XN8]
MLNSPHGTFTKPTCPICGEAVPFFARWNISIFRPAYCPACSSAVTFSRAPLVIQLLLYVAMIPMFYLVFGRSSWVGFLGLAAILALSALVATISKLKPVSAHVNATVD